MLYSIQMKEKDPHGLDRKPWPPRPQPVVPPAPKRPPRPVITPGSKGPS